MLATDSRRLLAWLMVSAGAHAWAVTALPSQWHESPRPGAVMRVQVASVWDAMPHGLLRADPTAARYRSGTPPAPPMVLPPVPDVRHPREGLDRAPEISVPEPIAADDLVPGVETYRVLASPPRQGTGSPVASLQPPGAASQDLRAMAVASDWLSAPYDPASRSTTRQQQARETRQVGAAAPGAADAGRAPAASESMELVFLLHQAINQRKRYPVLARRQQREGAATIGFSLYPDGRVDQVNVLQTSGFAGLDKAALVAVAGVAPFVPARRYLSDAERFKVRIVFSLR